MLIKDPTKELRSFRVALTSGKGAKRGRGRGSFIDSVLDSIDTFYAEVARTSRRGRRSPRSFGPRRKAPVRTKGFEPSLTSTAISSQDEESKPRPVSSADDGE